MKYSSKWIVSLVVILTVMACQNLFNPSGINSDVDLGADGLIDYGNSLLQNGDNQTAAEQFEAAINLDSTKSEAYYGLAKATLRLGNFNPLILAEAAASMSSAEEEQETIQLVSNIVRESLGESGDEVNATKSVLEVLIRRDSLNQLWINYKKFRLNY